MNLRESKFCKRLTSVLYGQCAFTFKIHGHSMQRAGIPDLHIVHRRWAGYLELKVQDNKTSSVQKKVGNEIRDRNYPCYVFRCIDVKFNSRGTATSWLYVLEDFDGVAITSVPNLEQLLDILVELKSK